VNGSRNPVLPGFHPDPSVCRVSDEYFLVTSSFTYFPGVPIFRSTNLVDWTQIGNVLDRRSQLDLRRTEGGTWLGVFAPTLRYHDGRFWMITTVYTHDGLRNFFVTAGDPAGAWSEPTTLDIVGIDPDLAWDADDNCWVHCALGSIQRHRIDDTTGAVLSGPELTWSGTGLQYPEAPHLFEREGTWYLMLAEGGTERGHGESIARGPSPRGPWEPCPHNPSGRAPATLACSSSCLFETGLGLRAQRFANRRPCPDHITRADPRADRASSRAVHFSRWSRAPGARSRCARCSVARPG
jgi:beta-xylosidase